MEREGGGVRGGAAFRAEVEPVGGEEDDGEVEDDLPGSVLGGRVGSYGHDGSCVAYSVPDIAQRVGGTCEDWWRPLPRKKKKTLRNRSKRRKNCSASSCKLVQPAADDQEERASERASER
eukprot:1816611-Rhodomonas_salina.1